MYSYHHIQAFNGALFTNCDKYQVLFSDEHQTLVHKHQMHWTVNEHQNVASMNTNQYSLMNTRMFPSKHTSHLESNKIICY